MAADPEILFVCVHNAGRSQIAAGLVTLRSGGAVRARSAGSSPSESVNPMAVTVMGELGVDLSSALNSVAKVDFVRFAPNGTTLTSTIDGLLYACLTAGVFGWLWPQ